MGGGGWGGWGDGGGGGTLRPIRAMQDIFGVDILAGGLYVERVLGGWMSGRRFEFVVVAAVWYFFSYHIL